MVSRTGGGVRFPIRHASKESDGTEEIISYSVERKHGEFMPKFHLAQGRRLHPGHGQRQITSNYMRFEAQGCDAIRTCR